MSASICPRCGAALTRGSSAAGLCPACLFSAALSSDGDAGDELETLSPGATLGPFQIVRLLGRGGMATVYEAVDPQLERAVALKVLPPEFLHDATFVKRFAQEARMIAKLEHPNIVPIYASGIDEGIPWMSMRLLAGGNLGALLDHQRSEPGRIVRILREVAGALDYAHAHGVVHRDIKPTNLLLDDSGQTSVADFGLAQMLEGNPSLTRSGLLAGTPHYMAPEQALGKTADHRCDIYSLGIVAYEMFVGVIPFAADSPVAVLLKQVNDALPDPADGQVPPGVMPVIHKAAAKDPGERWPSATAFVDAIEGAVKGVPQKRDADPVTGSVGPVRSSSVIGAMATTVGVLALLATAGWMIARQPARRSLAPPPVASEPSSAFNPAASAPPSSRETNAPSAAPARPEPRPASRATPVVPAATQVIPISRPDSAPPSLAPSVEVVSPLAPPSAPRQTIAEDRSADTADPSPASAEPAVLSPSPPTTDVVTAPVRIRTVSPDYPNVARAAQLEGDVLLQAMVTPEGRIAELIVVRSVHPILDEAARKAVLQYEYSPGRRNGVPEPTTIRITVSFRMR